jgi:hypothetical protein
MIHFFPSMMSTTAKNLYSQEVVESPDTCRACPQIVFKGSRIL